MAGDDDQVYEFKGFRLEAAQRRLLHHGQPVPLKPKILDLLLLLVQMRGRLVDKDELMKEIAGKPPVHVPEYKVSEHDCLNVKLKKYYAQKRKLYEDTYPDFYDKDLRKLFDAGAEVAGRVKASAWLRQHRRHLMDSVCQWTNEKKYRVNELLKHLIERCDQLALHVKADDAARTLQVTSYVTTLVMNYLFTGKFKRTK